MTKRNSLTYILVIFLSTFSVFSQASLQNWEPEKSVKEGVALYRQKAYLACQKKFEKIAKKSKNEQNKEIASYYICLSLIKQNNSAAEKKALAFTKRYPTSTFMNHFVLEVGNHYYNKGKTAQSLKWFQKADISYLSSNEKSEIQFKMAMAYLSFKKNNEAKDLLRKLVQNSKYRTEATYYLGYIYYLQKDFIAASYQFAQISNNKKYRDKIKYYQLNMAFQQNKYKEVIEQGNNITQSKKIENKVQVFKIIGESYFNLKMYNKAIPNLEKYKAEKKQFSKADYYLLGYAYYKEKNFQKALENLNKITRQRNEIGQNAYYLLADCYLKTNKKSQALNAFRTTASMTFNKEIQENAWLNYAKLSYEIGNPYKSTPEVLAQFLKKYPDSPHVENINDLIVLSFFGSQDFKNALSYFDSSGIGKNKNYQKAAYYQGIQFFNDRNYKEAGIYFKIASELSFDQKIKTEAQYWHAETFYRNRTYNKAASLFQEVIKQSPNSNIQAKATYHMAYSYFKLKKYDLAMLGFERAVDRLENSNLKNDALLRLGDCQFKNRKYWPALETYNKVILLNNTDTPYALYQKALCFGFINRIDQKINSLKQLIDKHVKSSSYDDALMELGNTYLKKNKNNLAINTYDKLINDMPKSAHISKALLKKGLIYYNLNQNQKAIDQYKSVVNQFPNTDEALQAISSAKNVYVDLNKVDEYAAWVKGISFANISDKEIDNTMFDAAERKFIQGNFKQAETSLKKYLSRFKDARHELKAHFYLAEALVNNEKEEEAQLHYKSVAKESNNTFTEPTLFAICSYDLKNENWEDAKPYLEDLEQYAQNEQNRRFAKANLMKVYFEINKPEETIKYAEEVLSIDKLGQDLKNDALLYKARAHFSLGAKDEALKSYQTLEKTASGEVMAETLYYKAFFQNEAEAYDLSNETIITLSADYNNYRYWGVKGLVIMAKNNFAKKDYFQANFILENIIKSEKEQFPKIIEEAEILYEQYKAESQTAEEIENE